MEKETRNTAYRFSAESDAGSVRERNEDYFGIFEPNSDDLLDRLGVLAVVSDGMGGHLSGSQASRVAVDTIGEIYFEDGQGLPVNHLRWAFLEANRRVFERVGEGREGRAGTTCTAVVLLPTMIHIAHAGDSRAYLLRGRNLGQLTEDHSVVWEMMKRGLLNKEDVNRHPQRNIITRGMGLRAAVDVDIYESIAIEPGDRIVICSDGLTSMLDEEEIAKAAGRGDPEKACKRLIKLAKEAGGFDNITVILAEKL